MIRIDYIINCLLIRHYAAASTLRATTFLTFAIAVDVSGCAVVLVCFPVTTTVGIIVQRAHIIIRIALSWAYATDCCYYRG